jgi:hypothetical protein
MPDDELRPLLHVVHDRGRNRQDEEASSLVQSHVTEEEQKLSETATGERLS